MDLGLTGATAVISGGTQGIGLAVARELLNEGASVSICARREEGVNSAVEELSALGTAVGRVCDVSDHAATVQWMQDAAEALGGIDIVVHNATASGQPRPGAAVLDQQLQRRPHGHGGHERGGVALP